MASHIPRVLVVCLASFPLGESHAWLKTPLARNGQGAPGATSCPHCGQGDGPMTVLPRANGQWPTHHAYGSHGLCGDPFQGTPTTSYEDEYFLNQVSSSPVATYTAGQRVKFEVYISTHHNGHFSFRLCDKVISKDVFKNHKEGQDCLDQHLLLRVDPADAYGDCVPNDARSDCQPIDPNHPERWYLPPRTMAGNTMEMWYYIPEGVQCEMCTIQWYWVTGNTCIYDADYLDYFQNTFPGAGWNDAFSWNQFASQSWGANQVCKETVFAEEFWNCADVKINAGSGGGGGAHRRRQTPVPAPTPAPVSEPEPEPEPGAGGFAPACRAACGQRTGSWKSDFTAFEGNNQFCSCGFGGSCGFICAGGGAAGPGSQCPAEACSSGQYTFKDNTWTMTVSRQFAEANSPYRAFAYLPLCQHKATQECSPDKDFTLAFSFRTRAVADWSAYVKLLFWTDGGNLIGLIPPKSAAGKQKGFQKLTLVTFMQDDYPNNWADQVEIEDNTWYSVQVRFRQTGGATETTIDISPVGLISKKADLGVNVFQESNGPQLGYYNFGFGANYDIDEIGLDLAALSGPGGNLDRHHCEHGCLASAVATPTPSPRPTPTPRPSPSPNSCGGCLDAVTDWKETCAWSKCAGCTGCPSQTKCEAWCTEAPTNWDEKCDWIYCEGCSSCNSPPPAPPPPPATPAPTPPPGGGFCCTWSATGSCGDCEGHNKQDATTWCGASESQCSTCNGIPCF